MAGCQHSRKDLCQHESSGQNRRLQSPAPPLPSVKSHSQYLWISVRLQVGMEEMESRNIVLCLVLL